MVCCTIPNTSQVFTFGVVGVVDVVGFVGAVGAVDDLEL